MKRLLLVIAGLAASHGAAQAHAFLDHADPKVGSTVISPPAVIRAWFTRPVVKTGSALAVFDARGTEVDRRDSHLDADDATLVTVSVSALPPGTYKVVWNATCRDTHHTSGSFSFEIKGS
jgi:methionine-rich copper-binding protein CopC